MMRKQKMPLQQSWNPEVPIRPSTLQSPSAHLQPTPTRPSINGLKRLEMMSPLRDGQVYPYPGPQQSFQLSACSGGQSIMNYYPFDPMPRSGNVDTSVNETQRSKRNDTDTVSNFLSVHCRCLDIPCGYLL